MEKIPVSLNSRAAFDAIIKHPRALPSDGVLSIATIDAGTTSGRAALALGFDLGPTYPHRRAQFTTTVRLFLGVAAALRGRYDDQGMVHPHHLRAGADVQGQGGVDVAPAAPRSPETQRILAFMAYSTQFLSDSDLEEFLRGLAARTLTENPKPPQDPTLWVGGFVT